MIVNLDKPMTICTLMFKVDVQWLRFNKHILV